MLRPHALPFGPENRSAALRGTAALAVAGLLGLVTAPVGAAQLGKLVQITRGDLTFGGCTADRSTAARHQLSKVRDEPWVAANPADPRNLLVGHQQDRWSNGGARGLVADVSKDGGITWTRSIPPGTTLCTGG